MEDPKTVTKDVFVTVNEGVVDEQTQPKEEAIKTELIIPTNNEEGATDAAQNVMSVTENVISAEVIDGLTDPEAQNFLRSLSTRNLGSKTVIIIGDGGKVPEGFDEMVKSVNSPKIEIVVTHKKNPIPSIFVSRAAILETKAFRAILADIATIMVVSANKTRVNIYLPSSSGMTRMLHTIRAYNATLPANALDRGVYKPTRASNLITGK